MTQLIIQNPKLRPDEDGVYRMDLCLANNPWGVGAVLESTINDRLAICKVIDWFEYGEGAIAVTISCVIRPDRGIKSDGELISRLRPGFGYGV